MRNAKDTFIGVIHDFVDDENAEQDQGSALAERYGRFGLELAGDEGSVQEFAAQLVATNLMVGLKTLSEDSEGPPNPMELVAHVGVAVFQQGLDLGLALGEQGTNPNNWPDVTPSEA